eukprot:GFUD01044072.1.p1 GENE.GFUD01044072.1~~GFUD01044072.1.p1  ORF type:complete len:753 (+),score=125.16 GFUD01044072.1:289-2547(+)
MNWSTPNSVMNSSFVRVNVHNSSWRPPGKNKEKYWSIFGISSNKLLRRSLTSYILWQLLACLPNIVVCESFETGTFPNAAKQPGLLEGSSISQLPDIELEQHENEDQRQGRNLEDVRESRPLIKKPPSSMTVRWARSTTERSLQQSWTPSLPKPEHFPKPAFLLPFGRKISRDSQTLRKATTLDIIKPSNIRKRNFGATLADALDKENAKEIAEKTVEINDLPLPITKFQGGKSPVPWVDSDDGSKINRRINENGDIKGERTRGAIVRNIPRQSDNDWERVRGGFKRPTPEPSNLGSGGSNIGQGSDNLERRGRIRIKSSFRGIYRKGQSTTRSPRTDDDVPQRPLKRDRIRNLRIRRPSTSNINSTQTTSTSSNIKTSSTPLKSTTVLTVKIPTTISPVSPKITFVDDSKPKLIVTTERIINLKGMVKEYKEIVRTSTTLQPVTVTTKQRTTEKATTKKQDTSTTTQIPTTTRLTTTTTITTTTTTTTFFENVRIKITARNSKNNDPVKDVLATVSLILDGQPVWSEQVGLSSKGTAFITVPANGLYLIELQDPGFFNASGTVVVSCTSSDCLTEIRIIMSPILSPGQTGIIMTWNAQPQDMDIYVMAIKKSDNSLCLTSYENTNGCPAITQDRDNAAGGTNGPETLTLLDEAVNSQYTYLVAIVDFDFEDDTNNGVDFINSGATLTVTNELQTVSAEMEATSIDVASAYYLFGCVDVQTDGSFILTAAPTGVFFNGNVNSEWLAMKTAYC